MAVLLRCFIFDDGYSPNLHPMICSIFIESFVLKTSDWLMKNWYKVSFGMQSFSVEIETKLLSLLCFIILGDKSTRLQEREFSLRIP